MTSKASFDPSISNFRFLCIFLMTFAHDSFAPSLVNFGAHVPYAATHSPLAYLNFLLMFGFSRISSPFLGFVSGYFISMNLLERPYVAVIRRRFFSLYVPAVFWSLAFFAVMIGVGVATSDHAYIHRTYSHLDLGDVFGIGHAPLDQPLHYLIDLFKCALVAPLLILVLRRFGSGIYLFATALIFTAFAGVHLGESTPGMSLAKSLPRADLYLFFSLGILAHRRWKLPIADTLDKLRIENPLLLSAIALVFLIATFHWPWLSDMKSDWAMWSGYFTLLIVRVTGSLLLVTLLPWSRWLAERGLVVDDRLTFTLFCTHTISYFVLDGMIGWGFRAEIYGIVAFYLAPFLATGAAFAILWAQNLATGLLVRVPYVVRRISE